MSRIFLFLIRNRSYNPNRNILFLNVYLKNANKGTIIHSAKVFKAATITSTENSGPQIFPNEKVLQE